MLREVEKSVSGRFPASLGQIPKPPAADFAAAHVSTASIRSA
jgi:hypothetical protein